VYIAEKSITLIIELFYFFNVIEIFLSFYMKVL
jgi:hypothetical protein